MSTCLTKPITLAVWLLATSAAPAQVQSVPPIFPDPLAIPYTLNTLLQPCTTFATADFDSDGVQDVAMGLGSSIDWHMYRGHGRDGLTFSWKETTNGTAMRMQPGDMNGDGLPDLVMSLASGKIVVYLSNSDGVFTAKPVVGFGPLAEVFEVELGDLDADGDLDVVGADMYWNALRFCRNDGNGNLAYYYSEFMTEEPRTVTIGLLDGNSSLDVAVGSFEPSSELRVLFNDGAGSFPTRTSLFVGRYLDEIEIADFNGDTFQDLAFRSYPPAGVNNNRVWISNGDGVGGFAAPVALNFEFDNWYSWLEHGDLDNDGDQDLVTSDLYSRFYVLRNSGGGVFTRTTEACVDSTVARLADLDADGVLDIVIGHSNLQVLFGDGQAGFAPIPTQLLFRAPGVQLVHADFDQDGNQDEVVGSRGAGSSYATVCFGDGQGSISSLQDHSLGTFLSSYGRANPAAPDWDGDGDPDLVVGTETNVVVLRNDLGVLSVVGNLDAGISNRRVLAADFDADGLGDFLVANDGSNLHTIYRSLGNGSFSVLHSFSYPKRPLGIAVGDWNGDGAPDFAVGTFGGYQVAGAIHVWLSQSGSFVAQQTIPVSVSVTCLATGDTDGDGDLDLAARVYTQTGHVNTYLNSGSGQFAASTVLDVDAYGNETHIADMDSDGDGEIVTFEGGHIGSVAIFESVGNGAFLPGATHFVGGENVGDILDMNNDGRLDLVAAYLDLAANSTALCVMLQSQPAVTTYCTPKVNSLGCAPFINHTGSPSASAGSGFVIGSSRILSNKPGLFVYGTGGPAATVFQGGKLCMKAPLKRVSGGSSGGSGGCTGSFATDFNVRIASGVDPALIAGARVCGQWWSRDNGFAAPNNSNLTDAIEFHIQL